MVRQPAMANARVSMLGVLRRVAAYTNPDRDPSTGTTLFDLDRALGVVAVQNPPNDGRLNTLMAIDAGAVSVGFDIGLTDFYAAFQAPGGTTSTLMARTGTERLMLGTIGGREPVANLAVSFGTPFSPPVERVYGVTSGNELRQLRCGERLDDSHARGDHGSECERAAGGN